MDVQGVQYSFPRQQYGGTGCIPFSTAGSMDVQGVSISTISSMDVQGVSLSTASSMDVLHGCIYFHRH
jgi:hypothetical protein